MTYVKRILIFEINKVVCHFLYKDNERKKDWWIIDVDLRFLKPSNTFLSLWISLSFTVMNYSLHYLHLKALFDQVSNLNR
jgi:hypothetical protein